MLQKPKYYKNKIDKKNKKLNIRNNIHAVDNTQNIC